MNDEPGTDTCLFLVPADAGPRAVGKKVAGVDYIKVTFMERAQRPGNWTQIYQGQK